MEQALLQAFGAAGLALAVVTMVARRLRLPPVLIYLLLGAAAGPSVLGIVDPHEMEEVLFVTLEVLVAMVVFEGAFSIDVPHLRRVGGVIRNLLTVGLAVTFVCASLLAIGLGVLEWRAAILFGALVTVTGPTVIAPLVRQVNLNERVRAVLLGEGVLIDPVGAILAVVALETALSGLHADPLLWVPSRLLGGVAFGLGGAAAVLAVLRLHRTPAPLESVLLLLGMSAATYAATEVILSDGGLTAMAAMGVTLSATGVPNVSHIRNWEDDLSRIMIAVIYLLAAATVDLDLLLDLWPRGFLIVVLLMVVVRPLAVWVSALGSDLHWREVLFVGLIGPRGVVAVAVAAVGGQELGPELGGAEMTALVFLTVLMTVGVQSTYADLVAGWLRVKQMRALIAGAGHVGRRVAAQLSAGGYAVRLIERDERHVQAARMEGLDVVEGDCTDAALVRGLDADDVALAVAATGADQANLLFCQLIRAQRPDTDVYALVSQPDAVDTFELAGIHPVNVVTALSDSLMDSVGNPVLYDALTSDERRVMVEMPIGYSLDGSRVSDLALPEGALAVLLRRPGALGEPLEMVPRGSTVLRRGDRLVVFGAVEAVERARARLAGAV